MKYSDFLDLGYKPGKDDIIALFRIRPSGMSMKEAAARVASESSNGTWSELPETALVRRIAAKVFWMGAHYVKIAYPLELFELGSMPQLYSSVAGNIFGMKAVESLRLEDIHFPRKYLHSFRGPQFGIKGVRRFMGVKKRPLLACVPKPKVGLTSSEHAKVGYDIWTGGIDLLKDDENLTDQRFNRFEKRVEMSFRMRDKAESETGERKSYLVNVTAETREMLRRAKLVSDIGGEYVMADILTVGWAGLQTLRDECQDLGLAIHAHRASHAAFTRSLEHGVSMAVVADSARLVGVDQLHIGTVVGKLVGSTKEVKDLERELSSEIVTEERLIKKESHLLEQDWGKIKPVFPVSSGGLHPGILPDVVQILGKNIILQVGGGIHGHPDGSHAGARAVRQAVELITEGKKLSETRDKELRVALDLWGRFKPK